MCWGGGASCRLGDGFRYFDVQMFNLYLGFFEPTDTYYIDVSMFRHQSRPVTPNSDVFLGRRTVRASAIGKENSTVRAFEAFRTGTLSPHLYTETIAIQCFQSRWHRPQDVLCMGVHINHLLGSVPFTLNPLIEPR